MATKLAANTALAIGKSIAKKAGIPLSELTKDIVRKAPVPVRYKKLFFGPNTPGETKIAPSIKSSRAVAIKEGKALGTGLGIGIPAGAATQIMAAVKKAGGATVNPGSKPMGLASAAKDKQQKSSIKKAVKKAQNKKKVVKPKPRPKKPMPKVKPKRRPGS
tara:strand:- start:44 stop:526 length:483 start_codon:yes stop_codon:yes gene_type:complete